MDSCIAKLDRITGGITAASMALGWLFENNHNVNILAVSRQMLGLYGQLLDYRSAECDFQLVENQLGSWKNKIDQQLLDSSSLAQRIRSCVEKDESALNSNPNVDQGMKLIAQVYRVGNCGMQQYPGYF
jgi:hypothetical protein